MMSTPSACTLGYQYNGFSMQCEEMMPTDVCPESGAPADKKTAKFFLNAQGRCQECALTEEMHCIQCQGTATSCMKCKENYKRVNNEGTWQCQAKTTRRLLLEDLGVQSLFDDFLA